MCMWFYWPLMRDISAFVVEQSSKKSYIYACDSRSRLSLAFLIRTLMYINYLRYYSLLITIIIKIWFFSLFTFMYIQYIYSDLSFFVPIS